MDSLGIFFLILAIAIPTWAFFQKDHLLYWKRWRDDIRDQLKYKSENKKNDTKS